MSIRTRRRRVMPIVLTRIATCRCSCREYEGSDGKQYWVSERDYIVYTTDCHKKNPTRAKGVFNIATYKTVTQ